MSLAPLGRTFNAVGAMAPAMVATLSLLASIGSDTNASSHATATMDTTLLQATQQSLTTALEQGVGIGSTRLKLNLSASNVGISWLLAL